MATPVVDVDAMKVDVIVVGAGPAGCAAALELARHGRQVLVLERSALPQAKVCGDFLCGESLQELERLGLAAAVRGEGHSSTMLRLHPPGGKPLDLPCSAVTLGRQRLHALLQERLAPAVTVRQGDVLGPGHGGRGVLVRREDGPPEALDAELVILAGGARYATLEAFGVGLAAAPSAVAVRGYFRDLERVGGELPEVGFHPPMAPGFGWVFPLPGGIYNIGCLRFLRGERPEQYDLQRLLAGFIATFPPAARVAGEDDRCGVPCAGLLRCGLAGALTHAEGVLVAGEAAGSTLPFFGAGVGPALVSGRLAGATAAEALQAGERSAAFLSRYRQRLQDHYAAPVRELARVEAWLASPWRLNLLAWQVGRNPALRELCAEVLARRAAPRSALSWPGLLGWTRRGGK